MPVPVPEVSQVVLSGPVFSRSDAWNITTAESTSLAGSVRRDGTSIFTPEQRWCFPSMSVHGAFRGAFFQKQLPGSASETPDVPAGENGFHFQRRPHNPYNLYSTRLGKIGMTSPVAARIRYWFLPQQYR